MVILFLLHTLLLLPHQSQCKTLNKIEQNLPLHDGDVLFSEDGNFVLGFFSPKNSTHRFVGTWYRQVTKQTVFWVANKDRPIDDTSGVLSINCRGDLVLNCCKNGSSVLWSTHVSTTLPENATIARFQDTGNFILIQRLSNRVLWQSFDHPTDTMMPFMKLGLDRKIGMEWFLTSWKFKDDPGPGNFTHQINTTGYPQLFVYNNGAPHWRGGPWTGIRWSGVPEMVNPYIFNSSFVNDQNELSISYGIKNSSLFSRFVIQSQGLLEWTTWQDKDGRWIQAWAIPLEQCDYYGACGPNSNCNPYNVSQFACTCLLGFVPKSPADWFLRDVSDGCVRSPEVSTCRSGEGFVKVAVVKVPDTSQASVNMSLSLKECGQECLKNCSCTAYTSADERRGGFGCLAWYDDNLMDTRTFSDVGQDLYVRVDAVTVARFRKKEVSPRRRMAIAITMGSMIMVLLLSLALFLLKKRRGKRRPPTIPSVARSLQDLKGESKKQDFRFFDLGTISAATNKFSSINKLGKGGFGSVYRGVLENGKEIAIKRLSKSSGQGIQEFKNEMKLIAKLQHRNLVKILGCCVQEEEKILIYEYLPNKSLDSFLFDEEKRTVLGWRKRFEIAYGIALGILYLHEHSRLRIIHRDLKASNVLLDASMNPKISDFGMARIVGDDQIEGNTTRIVGTYGYMSPEYAMQGLFSIKSDVYSFGVLLLEIISGKRNSSFCQENSSSGLVGYFWELWKEGLYLDIVDLSIRDTYPEQEVLRCFQIGLLCVQELAKDRPTMSEVVFMLGNKVTLPSPNQPAYSLKRERGRGDNSSSGEKANSIYNMSLSVIEAR